MNIEKINIEDIENFQLASTDYQKRVIEQAFTDTFKAQEDLFMAVLEQYAANTKQPVESLLVKGRLQKFVLQDGTERLAVDDTLLIEFHKLGKKIVQEKHAQFFNTHFTYKILYPEPSYKCAGDLTINITPK